MKRKQGSVQVTPVNAAVATPDTSLATPPLTMSAAETPPIVTLQNEHDIQTAMEDGWNDVGSAMNGGSQEDGPPAKKARTGRVCGIVCLCIETCTDVSCQRDVMESLEAHRNILLREWTRHEGLKNVKPVTGDDLPLCAGCSPATPVTSSEPASPPPKLGNIECLDCQQSGLRCADCIVAQHAHLPLHRLQVSK